MSRAAAIVLLLLLPAACGGGDVSSSPSHPPATNASAAIGSSQPASGSGSALDSRPKASASGSAATASPSPNASGSPVVAKLANACRRRGETQALTVTGLKAGDATGFSTQYSDGSNELTNREYAAGYGSGVAGPGGTYSTTWIVPSAAPAGRAEVLIIWSSGSKPLRVGFTIPAAGQEC